MSEIKKDGEVEEYILPEIHIPPRFKEVVPYKKSIPIMQPMGYDPTQGIKKNGKGSKEFIHIDK